LRRGRTTASGKTMWAERCKTSVVYGRNNQQKESQRAAVFLDNGG